MHKFWGYCIVLLCAFFLAPQGSVFAAQYTYTGDGSALQAAPPWAPLGAQAFFPGISAQPEPSYSIVIIDYNASSSGVAHPDSVYGGLSDAGDVWFNQTTLASGVVAGNIYGGYSRTGQVNSNTITMTGGAVRSGNIMGGYGLDGAVLNNRVNVSGGTVDGDVSGGFSLQDGIVQYNTVTLGQAVISGSIYGGSSGSGTAHNNYVFATGAVVGGSVYGGWSPAGDSYGNEVSIDQGVSGAVFGGYSDTGRAYDNSVDITNAFVSGNVYGGQSENASGYDNDITVSNSYIAGSIYGTSALTDVSQSEVQVSGGTVSGDIAGGYSSQGSAVTNTVDVSGTHVEGSVYGGRSDAGSASGNRITMQGGVVQGSVYGSRSQTDATTSTVAINTGTVRGDVYGGYSTAGNAGGNTVEITAANVAGTVYGGRGDTASGNHVTLNGATLSGDAYAGYGQTAANDNSMMVSGKSSLESATLFGNNLASWETDNNTLAFDSFSGSIGKIQNFSTVSIPYSSRVNVLQESAFYDIHNQGRLTFFNGKAGERVAVASGTYTGTGRIGLDVTFGSVPSAASDWIEFATISTSQPVPVAFLPTEGSVGFSHETPLRFAHVANNAVDNLFVPTRAGYGIYVYDITRQGNDYYLNLTNEQAELMGAVYSEAAAARLGQVSQNTDRLLRDGIRTAANRARQGTIGMYLDTEFQKTRYDIGNRADVTGVSTILALAYNNGTAFSAGVFGEAFSGDYSTKNSVTTKHGKFDVTLKAT